jgi:hypothetical protein
VSQLDVESMSFELCEEFDKLNLRIVANTEVMEMEEDFTLGYTKRTTRRRENLGGKAQYQEKEVTRI